MVIKVRNLVKKYDSLVAVNGLSFEVDRGEVFGLLGPNGAGKTTTIRIIMDILKPDEGEVEVLGGSPAQAKARVGYLPEERGLYRNLKVLDTLVYLAELKGVPGHTARKRAMKLLEKVELEEWASKKVKELSRGMQQKLQFIASIVHDPEVIFLDEPFQGLDPVNVELIKGLIMELHGQGKTVVLSTHQMNLVEALCDRILLINKGQAVLYGPLREIKKQFAPNTILVRAPELPAELPGVSDIQRENGEFTLTLVEGTDPNQVLRALLDHNVALEAFEVAPVPLEDIFVAVVSGHGS